MAIAIDNAGITLQSATATSLTYSFTINASNNTILFVGVQVADTGDVISGVAYNSVAMTRIGISASAAAQRVYLYALANPTVGTHNVVVSATGTFALFSRATSYTGAAQTGIPDASATNTALAAAALTTTVTVVAPNSWAVAMYCNDGGNSPTISGATFRDASDGLNSITLADSNGVLAAGARSFVYTGQTGSQNFAGVMCSFAPVAGQAGRMFQVF